MQRMSDFLRSYVKHGLERRFPHSEVTLSPSSNDFIVRTVIGYRELLGLRQDEAARLIDDRCGGHPRPRRKHASAFWRRRR